MKTKAYLHLIIYIAIAGLASACENEIPYNPGQQENQLILNALLDAGTTENYVHLSLSEGNKIRPVVSQATLTLSVNGKPVESPRMVSPGKFLLTTVLHPGDRLFIEAGAENGKYRATAEAAVPQPVSGIKVDTLTAFLQQGGGTRAFRQYLITLQDRLNERNYYRLDIRSDYEMQALVPSPKRRKDGTPVTDEHGSPIYEYKDTLLYYSDHRLINREDVILTDGQVSNSEEDEENTLFPAITNKYNIFSDNRFSNSSATLKVYTFPDLGYIGRHDYTHIRLLSTTVRLLSLNREEYQYLRALNCLEDDNYDNTIMEPVSVPSNVAGGMGFVSVSSEVQYRFIFPDK